MFYNRYNPYFQHTIESISDELAPPTHRCGPIAFKEAWLGRRKRKQVSFSRDLCADLLC